MKRVLWSIGGPLTGPNLPPVIDGPRLEDGAVGAAAVWWEEEGRPPPWVGPVTGRTYTTSYQAIREKSDDSATLHKEINPFFPLELG